MLKIALRVNANLEYSRQSMLLLDTIDALSVSLLEISMKRKITLVQH